MTTPSHHPATIRSHDAIKADCELVRRRLVDMRKRVRDGQYMSPKDFDLLTEQISMDTKTLDKLLAELFSEMCWQNPELLDS